MKDAKEKLRKFLKSENLRTAAENLPKGAVTFLLSAPAAIFFIAMAAEFLKSLFFHNTYSTDINWINFSAAITGQLAIAAYFLKLHYERGRAAQVLKNPAVLFFGGMIALMLLSSLYNGFSMELLIGDFYRKETLGYFVIYPAIYYFVSSLIDSENAKRRLVNGFLAVSSLIAAAVLLHIVAARCGLTHLADFTSALCPSTVIGIYHNINHYAYSLVVAICLSGAMFLFAGRRPGLLYLACFALLNAVLVLNDTFGAYLAVFTTLAVLIVFFLIRDRRPNPKTFVLLGVFVAVSLAVNFRSVWTNISIFFHDIGRVIGNIQGYIPSPEADGAGTTRWRLWKATFQMITERPLLGYGVEGIGARLLAEAGSDRPHNEFLEYAAFFGVPAMVCYVGAVVSVFLNFLRRWRDVPPCTFAALTAAFGYLVSSCFGNTMYYTAPLFFLVLGMAEMYPPKLADTAGT